MIPAKPSLEFDRKKAKALLRAVKQQEPAALARFEKSHPRGIQPEPKLSDAQTVIAREYGFPSWPQWKTFVETRTLDRKKQATFALQHSCSNSISRARTLLKADPALIREDDYLACACGEIIQVRKAIEADPGWVQRRGGVNHWTPMEYACFSRWLQIDRDKAAGIVEVVRLLLDHGADPNSHHIEKWDGEEWRQMPLYGASGIANNPELTRLLLDAGADVNELYAEFEKFATETLYHTAEHSDNRCLAMVLEAKPYPYMVRFCIFRALDHENPEAVRLFLAHGADPNYRVADLENQTPLLFAISRGRSAEIIRLLLDAGADPMLRDETGKTSRRLALRMGRADLLPFLPDAGDATEEDRALFAILQGNRNVMPVEIPPDLLCRAAFRNDVAMIDSILAAGADINALGDGGLPPVQEPAWFGRLDGVKTLVERGADIHLKNLHGGDALGATIHGSQNCCSSDGGLGMWLAEEAHPAEYAQIVEYLIGKGAKLPDRIWGGSEVVQELLRKHGVADAQ